MRHEILHRPSFALAQVRLEPGELIQAEPGSMISMSDEIKVSTGVRGGLLKGIRRKVFGGESFFMNTFAAESEAGEVCLGPALAGDIEALELNGGSVLVQSGSFLAATQDVVVDTQFGGARSMMVGEGFYLLRCSGYGLLLIASYGAIHRVDLEEGQRYTVDNGHMVAFDETVNYNVGKAGGWGSAFLGGEGLVCKLVGPGRFYMQTRSEDVFVEWMALAMKSRLKTART